MHKRARPLFFFFTEEKTAWSCQIGKYYSRRQTDGNGDENEERSADAQRRGSVKACSSVLKSEAFYSLDLDRGDVQTDDIAFTAVQHSTDAAAALFKIQ